MAINFCRAHHSPTVRCSKVSTDGFEVENLISSEEERRRKGFQAASFVGPPVEIIVTFPHSVDVSHIVLGLKNGSQRTTAIKLYTSNQDPAENDAKSFNPIGYYENITESQLFAVNYRYRPTRLFQSFSQNKPPVSETKKLYPKFDAAICKIRTLKICITKTANSTIPVLSELQVWGQPGTDCSMELKKMIFDIEREESVKPQITPYEEQHPSEEAVKNVVPTDEENADIPSEFLDSITYELMSQPVLLPSGNNVDRSTLEKYIETSSAWGRLPGDPFTGVPFGPLSRPTSNVSLKHRIDNFWLTNPHLCYGGRCTGVTDSARLAFDCEDSITRKNIKEFSTDNLYSLHKKYNSLKSKVTNKHFSHTPISAIHAGYKLHKSNKNLQNSLFMPRKPKSETSRRSSLLKRSASSEIPIASKALKKSAAISHVSSPLNSKHMKELSSSLEFGLKQVLSGRPSFIESCEVSEKSKSRNCSICNCLHLHGAYRLPCSHTLCRSCLVRETTNTQPSCKTCDVSYLSSEVVRFYE